MNRVLSPLAIKNVLIPNRVTRTAHVTNYGADGRITDRFIAYHEARARGGVGLTILEGASCHSSSFFHPNTLRLDHPYVVEDYQRLMSALRPYPMRVFQQLWHGGYNAGPIDGSPPWSASSLPGPLSPVPAVAMTQAQIDEVVAAFAAAARRVSDGGLQGCEVHGAHGYLFGQFMAQATNRREDAYGGDLAGRSRLLIETLRAIRAATPESFIVGVRLGPELTPGGVTIEETGQVLEWLQDEGLIDVVNFSVSNYNNVHLGVGALSEPAGYELGWTGGFKARSKVPVIVTGRIRALDEAEQVLAEGRADLVGMTRAHIADPDIVVKSQAGHWDQVRPCIACNQMCIGGMFGPTGQVGCTVNPQAGAEGVGELTPHSAARPRRVAVVGGGPAGMKAAATAAARGHQVTLYEARPDLGGAARLAGWRAPRMGTFRDLVDHLEREVYSAGVEVRLSSPISPDELDALGADLVIVATGSCHEANGLQIGNPGQGVAGLEQAHVLTAEEALVAPVAWTGQQVVVLDDVGHYEGVAVAEHLMSQGAGVCFVTRHASFAPLLAPALRALPSLERLRRGVFDLRLQSFLQEIGPQTAILADLPGGATRTVPADAVVLIGYGAPTGPAFQTSSFSGEIRLIGDALSQRFLPAAIHEGYRAGLAA